MKLFLSTCFFLSILSPVVLAEGTQTPLGLEAVTGVRSNYIQRGFKVADQVLDFQLEGEVSLSNTLFLNYGGWYLTETDEGDYSELGFRLALTKNWDNWQLTGLTEYKDIDNSEFDSGFYLSSKLKYFFTQSESDKFTHSLSLEVAYDTGAEGFFTELEFTTFYTVNKDSYLQLDLAATALNNYYDASGARDFNARLTYTYQLTDQVSISPFTEISVALKDRDDGSLFASGIWFEVSF